MQTVELTDVYKASAEVASLGSSDKLMVTDSSGVQKRIGKSSILSDINDFGVNLIPGSLKLLVSSSKTFLVESGTPLVLTFDSYEVVTGETPDSFRVINRQSDDSSPEYLDAYPGQPLTFVSKGKVSLYPHIEGYSSNKGYFHKIKLEKGYSASKWSPAPEDFIQILGGGGINHYLPTHYAILQKGGLRDGDDRTHQFAHQKRGFRLYDVAWHPTKGFRGSKHNHLGRRLCGGGFDFRRGDIQLTPGCEKRLVECVRIGHNHYTGVLQADLHRKSDGIQGISDKLVQHRMGRLANLRRDIAFGKEVVA